MAVTFCRKPEHTLHPHASYAVRFLMILFIRLMAQLMFPFFLFSVSTLGMFPRPHGGGACALQPSSNSGPQVLEVLMLSVSEELV